MQFKMLTINCRSFALYPNNLKEEVRKIGASHLQGLRARQLNTIAPLTDSHT